PLGTGACGTIVTPDTLSSADANKMLVLLQTLGGGSRAQTLNVLRYARFNVQDAFGLSEDADISDIPSVGALSAALNTAGFTPVTETEARAAHEQYMANISTIPEAWYGKELLADFTSDYSSGPSAWCDDDENEYEV